MSDRADIAASKNDSNATSLVSVVMPVYNSEEYVADALKSLLSQDFDRFEIIAVDDGSTDGSGAICNELAQQDERLRVIHKENGGLCSARNAGIDAARGEYIMFCDNDDTVLPGFIADNYEIARQSDADLVRFGRMMLRTDGEGKTVDVRELTPEEYAVYEGRDILDNIDVFLSLSCTVWAGIYKRSFLNEWGIRFDEELRSGGEDHLFNDHVYLHAQRIALNPRTYYQWMRRGDHSTSLKLSQNLIYAFQKTLASEHDMLTDADVIARNPKAYADHMTFPVMDTLTAGVYARRESLKEAHNTYSMLHELYEPYFAFLKQASPSPKVKMALFLLSHKLYRLLYVYMNLGVRIKTLLNRVFRGKK